MSVETEKKYLILGLNEDKVRKYYKHKDIEQYYLDLTNSDLREYLYGIWPTVTVLKASEVRVRFINECRAVLTMKSAGEMTRMEFEHELDNYCDGVRLKTCYAISGISKTRYNIPVCPKVNDLEIDFYRDRDLVTAELEFDPTSLNETSVDRLVTSVLEFVDKNAEILDVTGNKAYKNANLAVEITREDENE